MQRVECSRQMKQQGQDLEVGGMDSLYFINIRLVKEAGDQ